MPPTKTRRPRASLPAWQQQVVDGTLHLRQAWRYACAKESTKALEEAVSLFRRGDEAMMMMMCRSKSSCRLACVYAIILWGHVPAPSI